MKKCALILCFLLMLGQAWGQNSFPSSGSVGIGTTTPSGNLQIVGVSGWDTSTRLFVTNGASDYGRTNLVLTGRLQSNNDAWGFGSEARNSIVFSSNYASTVGGIGTEQFSIQHQMATNALGFLSQARGSLPIMVMTQEGNVGIGPVIPEAKLHVNGGSIMASDPNYSDINVRLDGTGIPTIKFSRYTGSPSTYHNAYIGQFYNPTLGSYSLGIGTGASSTGDPDFNNNVITIPVNGNVGVGTSNPVFKLDVEGFGSRVKNSQNALNAYTTFRIQGPDYSEGLEIDFFGNNNINSDLNWSYGGGAGSASIINVNPKPLVFGTNNQGRMLIDGAGNVAIGTNDPKGFKLAVAGKAVAEEINVMLQGSWPDYVFDSHYKLPVLSELEAFIASNKHLPEVPTAEEVKQNGVSLGEMNAILLKKVEELTMYVIEQNKRLESQESRIDRQEKLIESLSESLRQFENK